MRVSSAATVTVVVGMLPVFLLGATAVLVRRDLGFSQGGLGVATGVFFAAIAVTSVPSGTFADRVGPRRALLLALATSGVATGGVAMLTPSLVWLIGWMILGGVAGGLALAAASLALVRGVGRRGGVLFGVQQSAIPITTLLGGLAIPMVALTLGWRWTFGLGLVLVPAAAVLIPAAGGFSRPTTARDDAATTTRLPHGFVLLATATGMASAGGIATSSFLVESAVDRGMTPSAAGLMLASASVVCIGTRLLVGWRADRRQRGHLAVVGMMLLVAAVGQVTLGLVDGLGLIAVGSLLAFGIGYGWPGLLFHGVAVLHPAGVGSAIGAVNAGGAAGAALGPALFGVLAGNATYEAAWLVMSAISALGAGAVFMAVRRLDSHRASQTGEGRS